MPLRAPVPSWTVGLPPEWVEPAFSRSAFVHTWLSSRSRTGASKACPSNVVMAQTGR
jgi:hypothetical protein